MSAVVKVMAVGAGSIFNYVKMLLNRKSTIENLVERLRAAGM
jgi:hypothetical protein